MQLLVHVIIVEMGSAKREVQDREVNVYISPGEEG